MTASESFESATPLPGEAFLVIHRGPARRSVVPLRPGEIMTIGRANANRIVIPDAKCSRHHCEIFFSEGRWAIRDLGSRNGVLINGTEISGEAILHPAQVLMVGSCEIEFTDHPPRGARIAAQGESFAGSDVYDIIERASGTRFDKPLPRADDASSSSTRQRTKPGLDELYQLARSMAEPRDTVSLAQETLDGLFAGTSATVGAVLLLPEASAAPDPDSLECVAFHSMDESQRTSVSNYLSRAVCADHEAVLARDLSTQESLSESDDVEDLTAESAICTPVRAGDQLLGVIHLYATNPDLPLDANDLEFALAVSDQFAIALENVRDRESLEAGISRVAQQNVELLHQLEVESELVGDSEQMQALRQQIGRVAPSEAIVLVRGESGVGKELVARAVHFNSNRRHHPFVCVNCAALTESLLESELFGHEKGSFTGAAAQKSGKFEQAHLGTLFLDEVGEMSPEIQSKFLRVLEGHSFERVGGSKPVEVDVRVVTATNRHLEQAVKSGEFRQDLFFRLQVLEIVVPPLREHPEDIPTLAKHFLAKTAARSAIKVKGFTEAALDVLRDYWWPGNVRELKNVIERSVILSDSTWLTPDDVRLLNLGRTPPPAVRVDRSSPFRDPRPDRTTDPSMDAMPATADTPPVPPVPTADHDPWSRVVDQEASLEEMEQQFIAATLDRLDWNKSRTARQLGIERTTLDRKIKKYRLEKPE